MRGIAKLAVDRETCRRPAFFYRSAREGMGDFLANTLNSDPRGVLLPGFIGWSPREGSGVYDPVRSLGLEAGFYGLRGDLTVDLDELATLVRTGMYRILLVIHYFGRSESQMAEIRHLADEWGLLVVEDLAHGFFTSLTGHAAGQHGDMNLYSLHKMLPIPLGGMATYRCRSLVRQQRSTMPELAVEVMSYDWYEIGCRRRQNFLGLTERLKALREYGDLFSLLWPELGEQDIPQTLPVFVSGAGRDGIYAAMNAEGLGMVSLYHTLIDEVSTSHAPLQRLARHIINFPVHQDVRDCDLDRLVDAFRVILRQQ